MSIAPKTIESLHQYAVLAELEAEGRLKMRIHHLLHISHHTIHHLNARTSEQRGARSTDSRAEKALYTHSIQERYPLNFGHSLQKEGASISPSGIPELDDPNAGRHIEQR